METPHRQTFSLASVFMLITLIGVMLGLVLPLGKTSNHDAAGWIGGGCMLTGLAVGIVLGLQQRRRWRGLLAGGFIGYLFSIVAFFVILRPARPATVIAACAVLLLTAFALRRRS